MKTKIIAMLTVFTMFGYTNIYAFGFSFSSLTDGLARMFHKVEENTNKASANIKKVQNNVVNKSKVVKNNITKNIEARKKIIEEKKKKIVSKAIEIVKKEKAKTEKDDVKGIVKVKNKVFVDDNKRQIVSQKLSELKNIKTTNQIVATDINLGEGFDLDVDYTPNKVVSFDDIRLQAIAQFTNDKQLLGCDNPFDELKTMCSDIDKVILQLAGKDNYTINDVYKTTLLQQQIAKALVYKGMLEQYRRGAVILGVDQNTNLLKSIDIVRQYTTYDLQNNDVLPVVADNVEIKLQSNIPTFSQGDVAIVLGLRNGGVVGYKIYPLDTNMTIPGANMYKIMKIDGLNRCTNTNYETGIYKDKYMTKLGIGTNFPKNMEGIKFNFTNKCYSIVK